MTTERETVVILDFGSQYSQLIARRVREFEVYCELIHFDAPPEQIQRLQAKGYILSGGPASVYAPDAPRLPEFVLADNNDAVVVDVSAFIGVWLRLVAFAHVWVDTAEIWSFLQHCLQTDSSSSLVLLSLSFNTIRG